MICDTPAILDPTCRVSPKLEELEGVLRRAARRAGAQDHHVLRMGADARDGARTRRRDGRRVAWHTGSVPQQRRRAEIVRFKQDPACRLFLSTDCGSVGLNLQIASAVVNLDLPWNPAKLEQRIARAWRKDQTRVGDGRQSRLRGFDRASDSASPRSQAGAGRRRARRPRRSRSAQDAVRPGGHDRAHASDDAGAGERRAAHPVAGRSRRRRAAASPWRAGPADRGPHAAAMAASGLLAVLDLDGEALAAEAKRHEARHEVGPAVEVIDRPTWLAMRRLAASG